jgi:hypothetical protein
MFQKFKSNLKILIVGFRQFANEPKNERTLQHSYFVFLVPTGTADCKYQIYKIEALEHHTVYMAVRDDRTESH